MLGIMTLNSHRILGRVRGVGLSVKSDAVQGSGVQVKYLHAKYGTV